MKKYFLPMLLASIFAIGFTASEDDKDILDDGTGGGTPTPVEGSVVKVTENIGDADAAYVTTTGYFTYTEEADKTAEEGDLSSISYLSKDGVDIGTLLFTKADLLPSQLIIKDEGIIYFSYPSEDIVEIVFDNGTTVAFIGSYEFDATALPGVALAAKGDIFKAALANAAYLMKLASSSAARAITRSTFEDIINEWANLFETIVNQDYTDDEDALEDLPTDGDGNFTFVDTIDEWYDNHISDVVYYTLSLWTGEATFKVGGSSCTLSGTIWCPSNVFNDFGTYGILCDADPAKLVLGEAEYEGAGYQGADDKSFGVDFRGFKPNTTYYYRAYYKFNSADHGPIIIKYGEATDEVIYDTTIKTFTTGDNVLTVDVVMCIDVTGSMSGIINTVKNNAIGFYDAFKAVCDNQGIGLTGLNAQVIGFGDKNVDGPNWLEISSTYWLPDQKEEFKAFVNDLYAHGGGDTPESGLEALNAAFDKTDWSVDDGYHRQVVILWTDAPYLVGSAYTDIELSDLEAKWNKMPSGRRMIVFGPNHNWSNLEGWKNVIHLTDLYSGFYNFTYVLEQIVGELTSKARMDAPQEEVSKELFGRPNE